MGLFGFVGDLVGSIKKGLDGLTHALGLDKLNDLFSSFGGVGGLLAKLGGLATGNPVAALSIANDVFNALSDNKDRATQGATSQVAHGILSNIRTVQSFMGLANAV